MVSFSLSLRIVSIHSHLFSLALDPEMNPVEPVASQQAKDNIYETDELLHQYLGLPQNLFFSSLLLNATDNNVELSGVVSSL